MVHRLLRRRPGGELTAVEHLDVLIVGAGLSGIGAAHHLQTDCPWATYAIFEARDAIGGTWDLFRYPGIRSDSDMFTFGYPFRPWAEERSIADGAAILQYIRDTAAEAGIDRHIRFRHRIVAGGLVDRGRRTGASRAERTDADGTVHDVELTCSFLFSCSGYYRYDHGYLPDFAGHGRLRRHDRAPAGTGPRTSTTPGKRIVVIGSGATAVTLVPVAGRARRRTSRCCSARRPTSRRCRARTR